MQKYVIATHAPVTQPQAEVLKSLGVDVDRSASKRRFVAELSAESVSFLKGESWIKHVEPIIDHDCHSC
jgi:hypothetical protein